MCHEKFGNFLAILHVLVATIVHIMASVAPVCHLYLENRHMNACKDMSSFLIDVTFMNHGVGADSWLAVATSILL